MAITQNLKNRLLTVTQSQEITDIEVIQGVWGGYGQLLRVRFSGGTVNSVVVKLINMPKPEKHPKGWNTEYSHQRKLTSYQVESYWYQHYANLHLHTDCYLPRCLFSEKNENQHILILEDLANAGFSVVKATCSLNEAKHCVSWLAHFHAMHLQTPPQGLWPTGSYWHLETRPDELHNLQDTELKKAASMLDTLLSNSPFQTLIHGDAKLANFCFTTKADNVAAVDFQYVGKGCGMKDLILFISSAVKPEDCEQQAPLLVDHYFDILKNTIPLDGDLLENAWRPLYAIAWADFQRFVKGWSPDHWKINHYTETLTQQALKTLNATIKTAM